MRLLRRILARIRSRPLDSRRVFDRRDRDHGRASEHRPYDPPYRTGCP